MSYTRRNEPYNELSERIEAIAELGCYRHRWTHFGEDLHDNQQKLFCRTKDGEEYVIVAEYIDAKTALLNVPTEFLHTAYQAILTEFPYSDIVGDDSLIRVTEDFVPIPPMYGPPPEEW